MVILMLSYSIRIMDPNSSLGKIYLGDNVIEISSDKIEGSGDWNSLEYQDTAGSKGKKVVNTFSFYRMETNEISERYISSCFVNGLEAYDGEINLALDENLISNEYAVKLCLDYEMRKGKNLVKKEPLVLFHCKASIIKTTHQLSRAVSRWWDKRLHSSLGITTRESYFWIFYIECMRTHSQSRNSNCQQQQVPPTFVEPFNLVEPIDNQAPPVVTMVDNRTMAQLLEAPTEGYEDAIVVPKITANNFELKHGLLTLITSTMKFSNVPSTSVKLMLFLFSLEGAARIWLEKEPPRSILTWDDLVSKFINKFFPPSKTANLRNEITRFQQRFDETFYEAWD
ncbi:reverse transcriptase domain-containing protein [Tanacetum coccineum]